MNGRSGPSAGGETINDVSRDVSHAEVSDRRLWLAERCPACGAQPGVRCRERSSPRRTPPARLALHAARGFRLRPCPACKARPGEPCFTPHGRPAARPHTARLHLARGELHAAEDVWRALERSGAQLALVRFTGGGGRQGTLESVSIEAAGRELARWWSAGESALAGALAALVWGRYGVFKGQPRIAATLQWSVPERSLMLAGTRGGERFEEILLAAIPTAAPPASDTSRDTSLAGGITQTAGRACYQCGQPIPAGARPEACYCSKRCRQAASRARLRERSGRSALAPPERCSLCDGPIPTGVRPEARYCSKRCRQAASRARLTLARGRAASARRPPRASSPTSSEPRA
jgi:predicted nucleic acid-binding Zn ribbon protein